MGGLIGGCGRASIRLRRRRPISAGLSRGGIIGLTFTDQLHLSCVCWSRCLILIFTRRSPTSPSFCLARPLVNLTI